MKEKERRCKGAGEVDFPPASNPGWANRSRPDWAPPIRYHRSALGSSARVSHLHEHSSRSNIPTYIPRAILSRVYSACKSIDALYNTKSARGASILVAQYSILS